jgi:hypothetical protein
MVLEIKLPGRIVDRVVEEGRPAAQRQSDRSVEDVLLTLHTSGDLAAQ